MTRKPPVLLVHGAWHGAWCWNHVRSLLEQVGHKVISPDLPGHGSHSLPVKAITFNRYVDSIYSTLLACDEPVILVGHSMAGMVISAVAEKVAEVTPEKIHCLVFVNAYLPGNGDSIFSLMETLHPDSAIAQAMTLSVDKRVIDLPDLAIENLFYNKCTPELKAFALASIQTQASLPLNIPIQLSQTHFGQIKKVVLCSSDDRVIPPLLQRKMLQRQPCQEYVQIEGDHSVFYSAPMEVAEIISAQSSIDNT